MKSSRIIASVIAAVLAISLLAFAVTYSVPFYEVAIITTFGEAKGVESVQSDPGLHFKWPTPIQAARTYDRRMQLVDSRLETQATRDGRQVIVQSFVLWQIDDSPEGVLNFDRHFGSLENAKELIERRMRSAVSALSEFDFDDMIGENNKLEEAEAKIMERLIAADSEGDNLETLGVKNLEALGVKINKVGLSQVILPLETTRRVVDRMKTEQEAAADIIANKSNADTQRITSEGAGDASKILRFADLLAQKIKAQGEKKAAIAIAELNQEPELAKLLVWLDALEKSTENFSTFFIPTTFAPFHLLNVTNPNIKGSIPVPENDFTMFNNTTSKLIADDNSMSKSQVVDSTNRNSSSDQGD